MADWELRVKVVPDMGALEKGVEESGKKGVENMAKEVGKMNKEIAKAIEQEARRQEEEYMRKRQLAMYGLGAMPLMGGFVGAYGKISQGIELVNFFGRVGGAGAVAGAAGGIAMIAQAILELIKQIVNILAQSSKLFAVMLRIFKMAFEMALKPIAMIIAMIFMPLAIMLLAFFTGIFVGIMQGLKESGLFTSWGMILKSIWKMMYKVGYALGYLSTALIRWLADISKGSSGIGEKIDGFLKWARNGWNGLMRNFGEWKDSVVNSITSAGKDFVNGLQSIVAPAIKSIGDIITGGFNFIKAGEFIRNIANAIGSVISNSIKAIFDIGAKAGGFINAVKGFFGFQVGGIIPYSGLYYLHGGEMVVPSSNVVNNMSRSNVYNISINVEGGGTSEDIVDRIIDRLKMELSGGGM